MQRPSRKTSKEEWLLGALGLIGISGFVMAFAFALNHASIEGGPKAATAVTPITTGQGSR
jgi:hypothetical protein